MVPSNNASNHGRDPLDSSLEHTNARQNNGWIFSVRKTCPGAVRVTSQMSVCSRKNDVKTAQLSIPATMDEIHLTALWNTPTPVKITDESFRLGKHDSRLPGAARVTSGRSPPGAASGCSGKNCATVHSGNGGPSPFPFHKCEIDSYKSEQIHLPYPTMNGIPPFLGVTLEHVQHMATRGHAVFPEDSRQESMDTHGWL